MNERNLIRTVFLGADDRVRSGWRLAAFALLFLVLSAIGLAVAFGALASASVVFDQKSLTGFVLPFVVMSIATLAATFICQRVFEKLPERALGLGLSFKGFRNFIYGSVAGALSIALAAAVSLVFGGTSFSWNENAGTTGMALTLGTTFVIFFAGALWEEIMFRGYPLQTFARSGLAVFGVALTSILFASMHNGNPGANPLSWLNTLLAGLWLAACYFKTKDLWFAFGTHMAWNWFQGAVFGINVSGLAHLAPAPVMRAADHGPEWFTGGAYGLEGGVACTIALLISTAAIWFLPGRMLANERN